MPNFICPNCKERSIDIDRKEGMFDEAVACHHCGFGFLFELIDDYYPAPTTGLVTCDQDDRARRGHEVRRAREPQGRLVGDVIADLLVLGGLGGDVGEALRLEHARREPPAERAQHDQHRTGDGEQPHRPAAESLPASSHEGCILAARTARIRS